jgi:TRAP-type C4-dicarboxylate transport system permease small subunit
MKEAKHNRSRELCLLISLLFLLVFNYPLVLAFNRTLPVFGIPLIILYLLGGWLLFIFVIFLVVRNLGRNEGEVPEEEEGRTGP